MASRTHEYAVHGSANTQNVKVNIDPATLERLEALEDAQSGARRHQWTDEEDAILLRYWPVKRKEEVAAILGYGQEMCRRRYRELTSG